jgi:hypothetical protein
MVLRRGTCRRTGSGDFLVKVFAHFRRNLAVRHLVGGFNGDDVSAS